MDEKRPETASDAMNVMRGVAMRAAAKIVPICLSRTCFKEIGYGGCFGCDDSIKERERVAAIIESELKTISA